jgi:hypothetical protein
MRIIYLVIRIMQMMTHSKSSSKKILIQLLEVERNEFTKHHRDTALKIWLALLSLLVVEIHCLTRMPQTRNTVINVRRNGVTTEEQKLGINEMQGCQR